MATVKNTSDDYTITVADGLGLLTINADLDVVGNITYIDSTELRVTDPFITVAYDNNGAIQNTTTYAGLRFNTVAGEWEISPAVAANGAPITAYATIASGGGTSPGSPVNSVQFNAAGVFTGNSAFTFDAGNAKVNITGQLVLANIASTPATTSNVAALYNKQVGSGGTGVYVISPEVNDELVSKTKAIVFGIIF